MLDNNGGLIIGTGLDREWPELDIALYGIILILSSDKSFGIKDCVCWVSGGLVLSGISDESIIFGEGDIRGGGV